MQKVLLVGEIGVIMIGELDVVGVGILDVVFGWDALVIFFKFGCSHVGEGSKIKNGV